MAVYRVKLTLASPPSPCLLLALVKKDWQRHWQTSPSNPVFSCMAMENTLKLHKKALHCTASDCMIIVKDYFLYSSASYYNTKFMHMVE